MVQKFTTPNIRKCYCGAEAEVLTWTFSYDYEYQVKCQNGHVLTKYCGTRHRAICRWNNRVELIEITNLK